MSSLRLSESDTLLSQPSAPCFTTQFPLTLPLRSPDLDSLFLEYNEYAKDQGFKLGKFLKKADCCTFQCTFGHAKA